MVKKLGERKSKLTEFSFSLGNKLRYPAPLTAPVFMMKLEGKPTACPSISCTETSIIIRIGVRIKVKVRVRLEEGSAHA